jgi:hypothetical protein
MLHDIVVDTNVLVHAANPTEPRFKDALAFVRRLMACSTKLCVDEGFSVNEAENRSHIGSEYLGHLRSGMVGFALVVHLASTARVRIVTRSVPQHVGRRMRMHVKSVRDLVFVRVAFNSTERILASHDFGDLPERAREGLRNELNVLVLAADEAVAEL